MNPYDKLRPHKTVESCECDDVTSLILVDTLTDNPLHCENCRGEVDPERISLNVEMTESIANWFFSCSALYRLWLVSGEYEDYAKERLKDANGQINREGRKIVQLLSKTIPTQLWFFHDVEDGSPEFCPVCCKPLDFNVQWGTGQCKTCLIRI